MSRKKTPPKEGKSWSELIQEMSGTGRIDDLNKKIVVAGLRGNHKKRSSVSNIIETLGLLLVNYYASLAAHSVQEQPSFIIEIPVSLYLDEQEELMEKIGHSMFRPTVSVDPDLGVTRIECYVGKKS